MKSIQRNTLLIIFMVLTVCLPSCKQEGTGEKWQKQRNEKTDVRNRIREISMEDVLIGAMAKPYVFDDYLIIADYRSMQKMVHIFNKNTFAPLCSFGDPGQGPKEITVLGTVAWNPEKRELYVTDHGQLRILGYQLDSLLQNPGYEPFVKLKLNGMNFPNDYCYINDTLAYGSFIQPTSSSTFLQTSGKWNMQTGEIKLTAYTHPADQKKRISYAVSPASQTLVECNGRYDLISLYNLEGELQCNVYGPNWDESGDRKKHFSQVQICGDKIIALYSGQDWNKGNLGEIFHVFNMKGDYLKTLVVGRPINYFCYDKDNNRIIMNLDDEIQFTYLDLEGLL